MRLPNFFKKKALKKREAVVENSIAVLEASLTQSGNTPVGSDTLESSIRKIPAVSKRAINWGHDETSGLWWCAFQIDISHPEAFKTIHYIGSELNHFSNSEFNGAFYPTAPDYELNPETEDFLEWMIDSWDGETSPVEVSEMLEMVIYNLENHVS